MTQIAVDDHNVRSRPAHPSDSLQIVDALVTVDDLQHEHRSVTRGKGADEGLDQPQGIFAFQNTSRSKAKRNINCSGRSIYARVRPGATVGSRMAGGRVKTGLSVTAAIDAPVKLGQRLHLINEIKAWPKLRGKFSSISHAHCPMVCRPEKNSGPMSDTYWGNWSALTATMFVLRLRLISPTCSNG